MNCKLCGKEIWLSGLFRDRDFCTPSHRRKFHQRLHKVIVQSEAAEPTAKIVAGGRFLAAPADCWEMFAPRAEFESPRSSHRLSVSEWACESAIRAVEPIAPQWESDYEMDVAPSTDDNPVALVATEREPLSQDGPMSVMSSAMPYDNRMERVMNLISKSRGSSETRKARGLHAVA